MSLSALLRLATLASVVVSLAAPAAAAPIVDFAGHQWLVRTYGGGPGPNEWDAGNVVVDAEGMHLKIIRIDGKWTCAEVFMLGDPLGFGSYQFTVAGDLGALDRNVVLGLFNYPGAPEVGPDGTHEIDIEIAQWGQAGNANRLNWTVHPPVAGTRPTHKSVSLGRSGDLTTHRFVWTAGGVDYAAFDGGDASDATPVIARWNDAPKNARAHIPQVPLVVHLNLWLLEGRAPADGKPVEIVIKDFRYTPA